MYTRNLAVTATFTTSTLHMRVSVRSTPFQRTGAAIVPDLGVWLQNNSRATECQSLNTEIGGHSKVCTPKCDETARCTRRTLLGHWMEEYYTAVGKDTHKEIEVLH